jgi:mRNA-degrading endonuclease RelE of RelBE toxin-antitoxin system
MAYSVSFEVGLEKELRKLYKRDRLLYDRIERKVNELLENPRAGKPMENILKGSWRVHVGHFVLMYVIDEPNRVVRFYKFEHHDRAY